MKWLNKDGVSVEIDELEDSHLQNLERYLRGAGRTKLVKASPKIHTYCVNLMAERGLPLLPPIKEQIKIPRGLQTGIGWHMSPHDNRQSILENGLLISKARSGYGIRCIWISSKPFYWGYGGTSPYDTYKVDFSQLKTNNTPPVEGLVYVMEDIPPSRVELWVPYDARPSVSTWERKVEITIAYPEPILKSTPWTEALEHVIDPELPEALRYL